MISTVALSQSELWTQRTEWLSLDERYALNYARAKSVVNHYKLTANDVLNLTDKFREFHSDLILTKDPAVATMLAIHTNLCIGTLAMFTNGCAEHQDIIQKLLTFEWSGVCCVTEVGQGVNIINMETTCTLLPSGQFDLHSPVPSAAKYMPTTSPSGIPCVAIVHARLLVDGQDHGPKVFLVKLNDGKVMNPGITARVQAPRGGASPLKHCITSFNHVLLESNALLGSLDRPANVKAAFFQNISRVISGTFTLTYLAIIGLRSLAYIAGRYNQRRTVFDAFTNQRQPIIAFSTQYIIVLSAIAHGMVYDSMGRAFHAMFVSEEDPTKRHFIATIFKATVMLSTQRVMLDLGTRCGAQGLQAVNQMSTQHTDLRGAAIAEGDIQGISIKFALDLLKGRISAPEPRPSSRSLLYEREELMITTLRGILISEFPPTRDILQRILPHCQALIEAIGNRMAVESAEKEGVDPDVIDMFVASVLQVDACWNPDSHRGALGVDMQVRAAGKLLPKLDALLEGLNVAEYISAPIVSDEQWDAYVSSLPAYEGASTQM